MPVTWFVHYLLSWQCGSQLSWEGQSAAAYDPVQRVERYAVGAVGEGEREEDDEKRTCGA